MKAAPLKAPEARADGYEGNRLWSVFHPSAPFPVLVAAPTEAAAVVAAAPVMGFRWTELEYHSQARVVAV